MIAAIDASVLVYLLDATAPAPLDKDSGAPVADCKARVDHLVATLGQRQDKLLVPTPALAEVLARAGSAGPEWLRLLRQSRHILIGDLDERAAVECAAMAAKRLASSGGGTRPRWKAKFDEQIVAIAAVEGAKTIYSDDGDMVGLVREGVQVIGIAALPLPPTVAQPDLLDQLDAEPPSEELGGEGQP